MAFSELQALVVESSFSSRKEIVSSLNQTGIVQSIWEAESVDDGLSRLGQGVTDTCLLGPTLSTPIAINFVRQGTDLLVRRGKDSRPCAFIAITRAGETVPQALLDVGVSGVSLRPFIATTFTSVVESAVRSARERWEHLLVDAPGAGFDQTSFNLELPELSEVLREVAQRLRIVSQDMSRGRLTLGADGRPSLAARDAMRLAIEAALPENSGANQIGSYDNLFVTALVDWFVDRSESTPKNATINLKRKLLSYNQTHKA